MSNKYVTNGTISIGFQYFKDIRKKPCVCVMERNEITVLGTFSNKENAELFMKKLEELTGAKEMD